jgi:hypothetical protein
MSEAMKRISFDEFSDNLVRIFERVISEGESIVIEKGEGELVALSPLPSSLSRAKTEEDWKAFRAAAGSWADVDTDAFLDDIYESRKSSRPPVEL